MQASFNELHPEQNLHRGLGDGGCNLQLAGAGCVREQGRVNPHVHCELFLLGRWKMEVTLSGNFSTLAFINPLMAAS